MQDAEQTTMQLVIEQLEELIVTLIEEIRERPGVAAAIFAALVGAIVGTVIATSGRRHKSIPARAGKRLNRMSEMAELAGLGVRLLENPIVRAAVIAQLKKRMPL